MIAEWANQIHQGDSVEVLRSMPESSVHTVMTSPPYWGLRDYGAEGQIGLEPSLDEYIATLLNVSSEIQRVLRPDGCLWLNIGDRYATKKPGNPGDYSKSTLHGGDITDWYRSTLANTEDEARESLGQGAPEKSLLLIPDRLRLALLDQGWIIRGSYPWIKDKPDSARDRLRKGPEVVIQATQEKQYWHDRRHLNEPGWFDIPPAQYPDAHYATFPEELVETPVRGTCPPRVCAECGTPHEAVFTKADPFDDNGRKQTKRAIEIAKQAGLTEDHLEACRAVGFSDAGAGAVTQDGAGNNADDVEDLAAEAKAILGGYFREFTGRKPTFDHWEPGCDCAADTVPGVVLDPFAGSGTTCMVARELGRRFVGIELNPDYVAMSQKRAGIDVDEPERLRDDGQTGLASVAPDGGLLDAEPGGVRE